MWTTIIKYTLVLVIVFGWRVIYDKYFKNK